MKTLFENQANTTATVDATHTFLEAPENIARWAYDVVKMVPENALKFRIVRPEPTFNGQEILTVHSGANAVSYVVTGEMLDYTIVFGLSALTDGTQITERVEAENLGKLSLPLKFMTPIMQREFQKNLTMLVALLGK
ncbi:MAG: hypothetical protein LBI11_06570 [Streptococcaceae bacterium]|jgi:hypothetical protein|nr:hypothetical protein [Streptococcaceae bacterium]